MPRKISQRTEVEIVDPPVPSYNISQVLRLKQRLQQNCQPVLKQTLSSRHFSEFIRLLHEGFPRKGRDIDEDVLITSVQGLAGSMLTKKRLSDTVWRLAGNVEHLRSCTPVPPWGRQTNPEWVPIQVCSASLKWTRAGKYGAVFKMQFLAGSPCPLVIPQYWTSGFCSLFGKDLGFTAPWHKLPYQDPRQLVNFRFYVKIDPGLCTLRPGFHEVKVPPGCLHWNKQLLAMRYRVNHEVFTCPGGYPDEHPCHSCSVGEDYCDVAVHAKTFTQRYCSRCRKDAAWFDPESSRRICLDCTHVLRRKGEL